MRRSWIHKGKKTSFGRCTSFEWSASTLVGDSVARLREQNFDSARYFDEDIYRQIRIAILDKKTSSDEKFARRNKWLARLSSTEKRRNVSRMKSSSIMREVRESLNALILFTRLWLALKLDHFKRLLDIHCSEIQTSFPSLLMFWHTQENDSLLVSNQADLKLYRWRSRDSSE